MASRSRNAGLRSTPEAAAGRKWAPCGRHRGKRPRNPGPSRRRRLARKAAARERTLKMDVVHEHEHAQRAPEGKTYKGSCFCGAVEMAVTGEPVAMGYCHCESCRKWSAGPVN